MSEKYSGQSQTEWGASWRKKGRKSRGSCLSAYHPPRSIPFQFGIFCFSFDMTFIRISTHFFPEILGPQAHKINFKYV